MNEYDLLFKICLLGDSNVGKTALAVKYTDDEYNTNTPTTIGMDLHVKTVEIFDKIIKVHIWDMSGHEKFKFIIDSYFRNCQGVVLIFDVNDRNSFDNLAEWMKYVKTKVEPDFPMILVGNKIDLERVVDYEECIEFALDNNIEYFETSVKDNINVNGIFEKIIYEIKTNRKYCLKNMNKQESIKLGRSNCFVCCGDRDGRCY